jgi:hypothetical protein
VRSARAASADHALQVNHIFGDPLGIEGIIAFHDCQPQRLYLGGVKFRQFNRFGNRVAQSATALSGAIDSGATDSGALLAELGIRGCRVLRAHVFLGRTFRYGTPHCLGYAWHCYALLINPLAS